MTAKPASRMTEAARERVREQLASGADDTNPEFLYSTTHTARLLAIDAGLIDATRLARGELANRGLDQDGTWVGFDRAREIHTGGQADDDIAAEIDAAEAAAAEIAQQILRIESLDAVNSDRQDFHELAVWQIKEALAAAFAAGQAAAR
jgi:hypothetical protein